VLTLTIKTRVNGNIGDYLNCDIRCVECFFFVIQDVQYISIVGVERCGHFITECLTPSNLGTICIMDNYGILKRIKKKIIVLRFIIYISIYCGL
jgi:hypothetical protein